MRHQTTSAVLVGGALLASALLPIEAAAAAETCRGRPVTVFIGQGDRPTRGHDVIRGTTGPDLINAWGGGDTVCGWGGGDTIRLGPGHDKALGEGGNDTIYGDGGVDYIDGGPGADTLWGGPGGDYCSLEPNQPWNNCEVFFIED